MQLLERVDALGGAAHAIEAGFFQEEIARSAYEYQLRVESGRVGARRRQSLRRWIEVPVVPAPDYSALERDQVARLAETRARRDAGRVTAALDALRTAADDYSRDEAAGRAPMMPLIVEAVRARASVGEISDTLRERWGAYRPG
jgi:methylmalonyl-CoA mutase N-terminal domain/subunit